MSFIEGLDRNLTKKQETDAVTKTVKNGKGDVGETVEERSY